ncbi:MAG TPA: AmmeMemoRadiSam system protein B [Victivallales bacterium]|nr:AmmeMemoRadiSam system protein B [Victivallales bacterium]
MKKFLVLIFLLFFSGSIFGARTLNSQLAGKWYTDKPDILKKQLNSYFDNVKERKLKNVIALILPHAGYIYSGLTAAYGIKEIQGRKFSRIIIIGPSHYSYLYNKISVPNLEYYQTPLGKVKLDTKFIKEVERLPQASSQLRLHNVEHSVQIEVPLLQSALGKFKLVPILVGHLDKNTALEIGKKLRNMIDENTLVIASSDFTHYGFSYRYMPFPLNDKTPEMIKKLDMKGIEQIKAINFNGFIKYINKTENTVCGKNAIAVLLAMLPPDTKSTLLNYSTSGAVTGDYKNCVSYASIAFTGKWEKISTINKKEKKMNNQNKQESEILSDETKKTLLKLARDSVAYYFEHHSKPTPEKLGIKITSQMKQKMGAFVTLHENGRLRGCIGEIIPRRAIYEAVIEQAINAAVNDYRFHPVTKKDLPHLEFEISALTPPKPVDSYKDIVIGKDGMTIEENGHFAVFLPQVAPEQGWDLAETLTHLSRKAGLSGSAWKNPNAKFTVFQGIVFNEHNIK